MWKGICRFISLLAFDIVFIAQGRSPKWAAPHEVVHGLVCATCLPLARYLVLFRAAPGQWQEASSLIRCLLLQMSCFFLSASRVLQRTSATTKYCSDHFLSKCTTDCSTAYEVCCARYCLYIV